MGSRSGLPGKSTFPEVAEAEGYTPTALRQFFYDPTCPKLESIGRFGGAHAFDDYDVAAWSVKFRQWRADAPARNAVRRAEREARLKGEREEEMARIRTNQMLLRSSQEAHDKAEKERAEWVAEQKRIWGA